MIFDPNSTPIVCVESRMTNNILCENSCIVREETFTKIQLIFCGSFHQLGEITFVVNKAVKQARFSSRGVSNYDEFKQIVVSLGHDYYEIIIISSLSSMYLLNDAQPYVRFSRGT